VYCHFDGYPDGVGKMLKEHYTEPQKIKELLANGDMSSLGETVQKTVFYKDRGEDLHITKTRSFDELVDRARSVGAEYVYLFSDSVWDYFKC
jgi:hypothetical protein